LTRIFASLSIIALSLLGANIVVGLLGGDYNGTCDRVMPQLAEFNEQVLKLDRSAHVDHDRMSELRLESNELYDAELLPVQNKFRIHFLLGLLSALTVLLVNSISITYFVGSSRWFKEVVETYRLDAGLVARGNALKRRTFPVALFAMLVMVVIAALGGASDPSTGRADSADWVNYHFASALIGTSLIAGAFWLQWCNIRANYSLITTVSDEVKRIRTERGMDDE